MGKRITGKSAEHTERSAGAAVSVREILAFIEATPEHVLSQAWDIILKEYVAKRLPEVQAQERAYLDKLGVRVSEPADAYEASLRDERWRDTIHKLKLECVNDVHARGAIEFWLTLKTAVERVNAEQNKR